MNKKSIIFTKGIAVLSIIFSILLLLTITESLGRGEVNTFLVFLTILSTLCGITGGILLFMLLEQGRILIKYQCITGFLFTIFYSAINNEWISPNLILTFIFLFLLISIKTRVIEKNIKNLKSFKENIQHLKFNSFVKSFFLILLSLFALIWLVKWEEKLGIFHTPNGEGLSFYSQIEDENKLQVSIKGGFLYDAPQNNDLIIVMNNPEGEITIDSFENANLSIRILNINKQSQVLVDDEEIILTNKTDYEFLSRTPEEVVQYIQNHSYSLAENTDSIKLNVEENKNYKIEIVNNIKETPYIDFYIMSDLHSGYITYVPELKNVEENNPDFIILNGDIVNWGYPTEYMIISMLRSSLSIPVYTTVGNHDIWNNGIEYYNLYFGPNYYSFENQNSYFIFLDTSQGVLGNTQIQWLESELKYAKEMNVLVFSHMSPIDTVTGQYDEGSIISDELGSTMFSKAESQLVLELMNKYQVDAFISGHSHISGETELNGTRYISTGALGGSVNSGHDVSYLHCIIDDSSMSFEKITVDGSETVSESPIKNILNTVRVFGVPFLVNKSLRISLTILITIFGQIVWFTVISKRKSNN